MGASSKGKARARLARDEGSIPSAPTKFMLKVTICSGDELPEQCKNELTPYQPNRKTFNRYSSFLVIEHDGLVVGCHDSQMEPEDVSFWRDLKWVAEEIMSAYRLGSQDALEPLNKLMGS